MKRFLPLLLLVCLPSAKAQGLPLSGVGGPPPSGANITVNQHQHALTSSACNSVTTCQLTFGSSVPAHHFLAYLTATELGAGTLNACTDTTGGSALNTVATALNVNLASGSQRISFVADSNAGTTVVTCTSTTAANIHMHIYDVSGLVNGTPLDSSVTNTGTQANVNQSLNSAGASGFANEIVFGFFYDRSNNDSLAAGSGFNPSEFDDGGAGNESSLSEVTIVSATGTQTVTATCGSGTNTIAQLIVSFHA